MADYDNDRRDDGCHDVQISSVKDLPLWFEPIDPNGEVGHDIEAAVAKGGDIAVAAETSIRECLAHPEVTAEDYPIDWNGDRMDVDEVVRHLVKHYVSLHG